MMVIKPISRISAGRPSVVPARLKETVDFQMPLISTSPMMAPRSQKLTAPSKPMRFVSGVGSTGETSSLWW